jgi:hypothetical protein
MTLGASVVAAGVVHVVFLATAIALQQLPLQRFGPAGEKNLAGPAMARQQVLPKSVQVLVPIATEDVRTARMLMLRHGQRSATRVAMVACATSGVGGVRWG